MCDMSDTSVRAYQDYCLTIRLLVASQSPMGNTFEKLPWTSRLRACLFVGWLFPRVGSPVEQRKDNKTCSDYSNKDCAQDELVQRACGQTCSAAANPSRPCGRLPSCAALVLSKDNHWVELGHSLQRCWLQQSSLSEFVS